MFANLTDHGAGLLDSELSPPSSWSPDPGYADSFTCAVCTAPAACRHFGATSCNACAAFFRRSVAEKKVYDCKKDRNCSLFHESSRRMCRWCRYKRCIQVGMVDSEVQSNTHQSSCTKLDVVSDNYSSSSDSSPSPQTRPDSILQKLVFIHHSIAYNRLLLNPSLFSHSNTLSTMQSTNQSFLVETQTFKAFLTSSELMHHVIHLGVSTRDVVGVWVVLESVKNTIKFDGVRQERIYNVDERFTDLTHLRPFYESDSTLSRNTDCIARLGLRTGREVLSLIDSIQGAHLDPIEFASLTVLTLSTKIIQCCTDAKTAKSRLNPFIERVITCLESYYQSKGRETATRLGNLIIQIGTVLQMDELVNTHRIEMEIAGHSERLLH